MNSTDAYRFERLTIDHLNDLRFLFHEVLNKRYSNEYLRRKYDTSFTGAQNLTHLAYDGPTPVAFYGVIPTYFSWEGRRYLAAQTCDYLTLPSHQRKGLHRDLSGRAFGLMREHGVKVAFALMSDDSLASGRKLGWTMHGTMQAFVMPAGKVPVAKAVRKFGFADGSYDSFTHWVFRNQTVSASTYINSVLEEGWLGVEYSPEFFSYKNFTNNFHLQLGEVSVWVKADRNLLVGDLNFPSDLALDCALLQLRELAARAGFTEIIIQASPETRLSSYLLERINPVTSWTVGTIDLDSGLPLDRLKCNFGDFDTF